MSATENLQEQIRLAPGQLIATRIKRARKAAGFSHDKLGALVGGVTRQHLIKLEQAKHRPRAEMLARIAEATGRDVAWFLDPEVDPSPFPDDDDLGTGRDAGRSNRRSRRPSATRAGQGTGEVAA